MDATNIKIKDTSNNRCKTNASLSNNTQNNAIQIKAATIVAHLCIKLHHTCPCSAILTPPKEHKN